MSILVTEVEGLYRAVVTNPADWPPESVAEWAATIGNDTFVSRAEAKELRRIVRISQRLRDFWLTDDRRADASITWRSRVDIAMGPRAWRPVLVLAMEELAATRSFESFGRVCELFAVVNNAPFMDGASFETWLEDSRATGDLG